MKQVCSRRGQSTSWKCKGFGELTARVHEAGLRVGEGIDRNNVTYGRTWHLDRIEDQADLAWMIVHVLKPKIVHLATPCTKQCVMGSRKIDEATKAMNDFPRAVCLYQAAAKMFCSVENPKGSLLFTGPDWVATFGEVPSSKGAWKHYTPDGCQLGSIYPGDDDKGAPQRKSQVWMANFDLSGMELRCRKPAALIACSHEHSRIRGRMKVDGRPCGVAESSGTYSPELSTVYAKGGGNCVRLHRQKDIQGYA